MARLYSVSLFPAYDSEFYSRKYRYDYNILILLGIGSLFVPVSLCLQLIRIGLLKYHFLFCITHTMCYTGLIGRSPSADVFHSMCSYFEDISTLCRSVTMRCLSENRAIHVYTYCLVSPGIMVTQLYHC